MQSLRVAIIGCGWVAGTQVREGFGALPGQFELAVCCDSVAERAEAFATEHGIRRWERDFDDVIGLPDIDVVRICTLTCPPPVPRSLWEPMGLIGDLRRRR